MIVGLRVDSRLIHGQVAFSYIAATQANCILVSSDDIFKDKIKYQVVSLTRPRNVKVVVKNIEDSIAAINSGVTDKYRLLIICENINDAYRVLKGTKYDRLNLGGVPNDGEKKLLAQVVYINEKEREQLKELVSDGVYCYVQGSAMDKEEKIANLL